MRGRSRKAGSARSHAPKTLYLLGDYAMQVSTTGESLFVTSAAGDARRIPLSRIMRIVCDQSTQWSGTAITTCLEQGIPINWNSGRGTPLGQLWPHRQRGNECADMLEALASDDPEWPQFYDNWFRRERLAVLESWAEEQSSTGFAVSKEDWDRKTREWVYRAEIQVVLPLILHGMATAFVTSRLFEHCLPNHWIGVNGEELPIARDTALLVWGRMNLSAGALASAIDKPREAAAVFERWAVAHGMQLNQHLARLRGVAARRFRA